MPVNVSRVAPAARTKTKTVKLEGYPRDPENEMAGWETSTVTYRPAALRAGDSPPEGEGVEEPDDERADDLAMARPMCELLVEWDFEGPIERVVPDGNGGTRTVQIHPPGPIPLVPEEVAKVEFGLLAALRLAVIKAESGNPRKPRR